MKVLCSEFTMGIFFVCAFYVLFLGLDYLIITNMPTIPNLPFPEKFLDYAFVFTGLWSWDLLSTFFFGHRTRIRIRGNTKLAHDMEDAPGYKVTIFLMQTTFARFFAPLFYSQLIQETAEQGEFADSPESKAHIPTFIKTYNVDIKDVKRSLEEFTTLNDFFYRRLRPETRPIFQKSNNSVAVLPADGVTTVFQKVDDMFKFAVKQVPFTLEEFVGAEYAKKFEGGSLMITALTPREYHRYHSPVTGVWKDPVKHMGETLVVYRHGLTLNILVEQRRQILPIETEEFGTVLYIPIGAHEVGSINWTIEQGKPFNKGDETGFFAYGGSTIVTLFQKNTIDFAKDLLASSLEGIDTLVQFGTELGTVSIHSKKRS